jgi:GNS1/SUR4 family
MKISGILYRVLWFSDKYLLPTAQMFEQYFHLVSAAFLLALFALYLWFVLVFGPSFMKDREAFNVTGLIRLYNAFQVFACLFVIIRSHQIGFYWQYLWVCEKFEFFTDLVRFEVKIGYWLFLGLRCVEFVETVFFVVRKKHEQASFLHLFHHIGSVLMTWLFIILNVGEFMIVETRFSASLKPCFVHRVYGCVYCNPQRIRPHLHVHLLLLQLLQA